MSDLDSYPIVLNGKFLISDFNDLKFHEVLTEALDAEEPPADYGSKTLNQVLWEAIQRNFKVVEIGARSLSVSVTSGWVLPTNKSIKQARIGVQTYGDWESEFPAIERSYDTDY